MLITFKSKSYPNVMMYQDNAKRILDKHGMQGYKEKWIKHDFPMGEYNRLKSLLKIGDN